METHGCVTCVYNQVNGSWISTIESAPSGSAGGRVVSKVQGEPDTKAALFAVDLGVEKSSFPSTESSHPQACSADAERITHR